jgi:PAS domain S-box-containing protein
MMPNTALSLTLIGAAGALRRRSATGARRTLAILAAIVVLALSVATLAEYALDLDLHIDQLLIPSGAGPYPGRMSPPTATALMLLAAALLLFDYRRTAPMRPSEWLSMSACLVAYAAALGQVYGAQALYRLEYAPALGAAVPTALSLFLTSAGLLFERPDSGVIAVVTSSGSGGVLLRRLSLAALMGPVALGFLLSRLLAVFGTEEIASLIAGLGVAAAAGALFLLVAIAVPVNRIYAALAASRTRIEDLVEQASDAIFVADREGRYTAVNGAACRMLGYARDEIVGMSIRDVIQTEDIERFTRHKERLLEGDSELGEWTLRRKDGTYLPVEVSAKILPDERWQAFVRDISERKRVEEQVRRRMDRLELALRGADLAAWDWNVTTGELTFNPRWAEMRGFRPEEIKPHVSAWSTGVHPDDWPRVQTVLTDHLEGRIPEYEAEHRVATKSGEWIWILDRGRVFARDTEGRPTRMVGTELDITARKQAEEAHHLSEARFAGIVSLSADAIFSIDDQQRITLFNDGAEKIFGYSSEEAIGASLDILIPERFRAEQRAYLESFAAAPETARAAGGARTIRALRKSGEEFPADAAISKLEVGGKRLFTVSLRDVTEQQRRESENELLAELGRALSATLESDEILTGIADLMVRSIADVCIVDVVEQHDEVRRLTVVSREPSKASACDRLAKVPLDRRRPHLTLSALEAARPVLMERVSPSMLASLSQSEEHLRALRAVDPKSIIAVPLVARDKTLGVIALVSTTPSRVYGQRDLRLAEELAQRAALSLENARLYRAAQRAVHARDEVLGVVAHDLRNPLGVIVLQARLLKAQGVCRKAAEAIERASNRMNRLIRDLVDMTSLEAGHLSIEQARLPTRPIVSDALESQKALAASASLELRLDVASDLPDVLADRDRLLQVLENLIGNAVKFVEPGGRITVGARSRDGDVLFWVADTGAGIAAEDQPHLFDRFWQKRRGRRGGAGLGLPIVKGLVEAHGGRVWVDSTLGRGSTFFFTIPAVAAIDQHSTQPAPHVA